MTSTYVALAVSPSAWAEIDGLIRDAGYFHFFQADGTILLQDVVLAIEPTYPPTSHANRDKIIQSLQTP